MNDWKLQNFSAYSNRTSKWDDFFCARRRSFTRCNPCNGKF
nr:MAG TPA: RNAse domain protein [Caudoviricetes sp.]